MKVGSSMSATPTVMVLSVVFTIDRGLYGFRHSDNAVAKLLTK